MSNVDPVVAVIGCLPGLIGLVVMLAALAVERCALRQSLGVAQDRIDEVGSIALEQQRVMEGCSRCRKHLAGDRPSPSGGYRS